MNYFLVWLRLIRVKQWVKNLFIFLPLFFGAALFQHNAMKSAVLAFFLFSAAASAVYIFNDIVDVEDDRKHPKKKKRPIASGEIDQRVAKYVYVMLLIATITLGLLWNFHIGVAVTLYLFINIAYTLKLKHIPIVDVFVVASGFVVRLYVGAAATGIQLSEWIVIMTFLLSLFLALAKRRTDVLIYIKNGKKTRRVVDGYTLEFLNASMVIMVSVCIVAYIMYTMDPETIVRFDSKYLFATSVFVLLGLIRYLQISFDNDSRSPVEIFYSDYIIQTSILSWILFLAIIIY